MKKPRHEWHADRTFENSLSRYIAAGAHMMRGMSRDDYLSLCRALWNRCTPDKVYAIKIFVEPLVDTDLPQRNGEPYCVLTARCDADGNLIDAAPGYRRYEDKNVVLAQIPIGLPVGAPAKRGPSSKVGKYLLGYFDILGFKQKLRKEKLEHVRREYLRLVAEAVHPQRADWAPAFALSGKGELVPGLMRVSVEVAYASDSIILFVPYAWPYVETFFHRCALLFSLALRMHIPLRGVTSFGDGVFDSKKNVFIGEPIVEASNLEKGLNWIGVALAKSMHKVPMIPPHLVQYISPPMSSESERLFSGLVLDWPRTWRHSFSDSAFGYLETLATQPDLSRRIIQRYAQAATFFHFSDMNQSWCIPKGVTMLDPHRRVDREAMTAPRGIRYSILHRILFPILSPPLLGNVPEPSSAGLPLPHYGFRWLPVDMAKKRHPLHADTVDTPPLR